VRGAGSGQFANVCKGVGSRHSIKPPENDASAPGALSLDLSVGLRPDRRECRIAGLVHSSDDVAPRHSLNRSGE
jgi:hypothetical protein